MNYQLYVNAVYGPVGFPNFYGCIPFITGYGTTTPAAPSRPKLYIEPQGHGNLMQTAGFNGHGIIYWPSNNIAETPSTVTTTQDIAYKLQWIDRGEPTLSGPSLWSSRLNLNIFPAYVIYSQTDGNLIGPHDIYYLNTFVCFNHCPTLVPGFAKTPWGTSVPGIANEHLGDWHNHPAWAWSHHFTKSGPAGNVYFDYSCLGESCRMSNTYSYNPYWSDAYFLAGSGTGSGQPLPCKTPPCPFTAPDKPGASGQSAGLALTLRQPEARLDFNDSRGFRVAGSGVIGTDVVTIEDADWGYKGGARVLRIIGTGLVTVTLRGRIQTADYDQLLVRYRRQGLSDSAAIRVSWGKSTGGMGFDAIEGDASLLRRSGDGWVVEQFSMVDVPALAQGYEVPATVLKIDLSRQAAEMIELDFVILTR